MRILALLLMLFALPCHADVWRGKITFGSMSGDVEEGATHRIRFTLKRPDRDGVNRMLLKCARGAGRKFWCPGRKVVLRGAEIDEDLVSLAFDFPPGGRTCVLLGGGTIDAMSGRYECHFPESDPIYRGDFEMRRIR